MSDEKNAGTVDAGIGFLSKKQWFELQAFAINCIHVNPTTIGRMATLLKMTQPADKPDWDPEKSPLWDVDFTKTVKEYEKLGYLFDDTSSPDPKPKSGFWNVIMPGMISLASDILEYQGKADQYFLRLIAAVDAYDTPALDKSAKFQVKLKALEQDWKSNASSDEGGTVKSRFISAFTKLAADAKLRQDKADLVYTQLGTLHSGLLEMEGVFKANAQTYETKYGAESEEVKNLTLEAKSIKAELEAKRKKEKDEVIVLSTAPLYLAIPVLGPFIMAGVLIGVGADLGVLREKIKKLVGDAKDVGDRLDSKQAFKANYDLIRTLTEKTAEDIKANQDHIAKLKDGWGSIASDFSMVAKYLNDSNQDAGKEEWFDVAIDLGATRARWQKIADRADHFRLNATITQATKPEEFLASVQDEKAA